MLAGDLTTFTSLLEEVAPIEDGGQTGTGTRFLISKFLITKFLIILFLITVFLSNKIPKLQNP